MFLRRLGGLSSHSAVQTQAIEPAQRPPVKKLYTCCNRSRTLLYERCEALLELLNYFEAAYWFSYLLPNRSVVLI